MSRDSETLIWDIGSYETRVGFAGSKTPQGEFRTVVGRKREQNALAGLSDASVLVGSDATVERGGVDLVEPVKNGLVTDFDLWEEVVRHGAEKKLKIEMSDYVTVFSAPMRSPHKNEQKMAEILFERFGVAGAAGVLAPRMTMVASGKASGLVVDIGHGQTQIAPMYDTAWLEEASIRTDVAGEALNTHMARVLTELSPGFFDPKHARVASVDMLKRTCCYVSPNYLFELDLFESGKSLKSLDFSFSDGSSVVLASERIRGVEPLFDPLLIGADVAPLPKLIHQAISKCPIDTRKKLLRNIVLTGGTSMTPGLVDRLKHDLYKLFSLKEPQNDIDSPIRIFSGQDRSSYTWAGGSFGAHLLQRIMMKYQYEEYGSHFFHQFGSLTTSLYDQSFALPAPISSH